ncbi:hypothetical protein P154DRAFT_552325 [Amniculicola lignicola CBS 123094]|uniref:Uncharacterized protein n=1 Tax=Amniculicola lignicola CBS 123094 TaxID=1392246 RepID=A0A6A5WQQ8_9PLEO|nr:hypothetical protein P154DRAFT_552325 [Amniculicola lignicola CBS 123094]
MLGTKFSLVVGGKSITAISVSKSNYSTIVSAYTILIQFLFIALWNLISCLILITFDISTRANMLGVVAFWNSRDPFFAALSSLSFLSMLILRGGHLGIRNAKHLIPASAMAFLSTGTLVSSIVLGIVYPNMLTLTQVAPVAPAAVFSPYFGEVANSTVTDILTSGRPAVLRALGSVEASENNSKLRSAHIRQVEVSGSNVTHPQLGVEYSYQLSAEDFHLKEFADLVLKVEGSCVTEYGWLQKDTRGWDVYIPWGRPEKGNRFSVANENVGGPLIDFAAFIHPDIDTDSQLTNRSFAFAVATSQVPSFTPSTDPWYYTASNLTVFDSPYVIKSGRPALSCWETTEICVQGHCYDTNLATSPLPDGLKYIFKTRFRHPMAIHIAIEAGVMTFKSYVGSSSGAVLDAHAASLYSDMERLILAGYLASREVFHEVTSPPKAPGVRNALEDESGKLMAGADGYVVGSPEVYALRYDLVILAPVLTLVLWVLVTALEAYRHGSDNQGTFKKRAVALRATHLFRMLDEKSTDQRWSKRKGGIPLPPQEIGAWEMEVQTDHGGTDIVIEKPSGAGGAE